MLILGSGVTLRSRPMNPRLPPLPAVHLELVEDLTPQHGAGFLRLVRHRYRAHYPDGSVSQPFLYDAVDRRALDATVIVAHYQDQGKPWVYLRSAVRPPISLRQGRSPIAEHDTPGLWELPAGLVEIHEHDSLEGVRRCAARELAEELGFEVPESNLLPLGPSAFPAPGFVGERHFFFEVTVVPAERQVPMLDGSPLEHNGMVIAVPLADALQACDEGTIEDEKTEVALYRLQRRLA